MKCSHLNACTYGTTGNGKTVWWCHVCGALALMEGRRGRPNSGMWQLPRLGKESLEKMKR